MMLAIYIAGAALVVLLSILFKVAAIFRLSIPLAYALLATTIFRGWREANPVLSETIFYILLGLTLLSWIYTLVKHIRDRHAEEEYLEFVVQQRFDEAEARGEYTINLSDIDLRD
ncbi:MAG: molecular chaperone GrpE [Clostridiales bacterium]|nr:molecular chaperone GrpE [Clostridiales bacterium]